MKKKQVCLIVSGLAWCGFGIWLWLFPETIGGVGLHVEGATGRVEVRAVYGGLELGLGAFLLWTAAHPSRYRVGLVAALFFVSGIAIGRASGIALEGFVAREAIWLFLSIEVVAALVTATLLYRSDSPPLPNPDAETNPIA